MQIYLDYSATTPARPEAIARMHQVMTESWGNPSSLHEWGKRSAMVLERARVQVANLIQAAPEAIVFTSGGTEANNLAIWGITQRYAQPQHLIISQVEHSAVAEPIRWLEQRGWQVSRLPVNAQGQVNPLELQAALQPNTVLVSIIFGQSEVGTLQPIARLANIIQGYRHAHPDSTLLFHTDAVQVAGRLPISVIQSAIDLLSLSSHKLYGPQGVGALYIRPGVELVPLLSGGGQEFQQRSGTQAVAAIAGFGVAADLALQEMPAEQLRLEHLRDRLFDHLADLSILQPTGDRRERLPHHVSFCLNEDPQLWANSAWAVGAQSESFPTGRTIVRQMNLAGIGISSGSACQSGKLMPSPVLKAMGYGNRAAMSGIRLTLGHHTTIADIDWTAQALRQILNRLQFSSTLAYSR